MEINDRTEERKATGRYTLEMAARVIEQETGERYEGTLRKLMAAAVDASLPVYEPGKLARYEYGEGAASVPRWFYEEAYWDDLNSWLTESEPRISFRFPKASNLAESNHLKESKEARQFRRFNRYGVLGGKRSPKQGGAGRRRVPAVLWRNWREKKRKPVCLTATHAM